MRPNSCRNGGQLGKFPRFCANTNTLAPAGSAAGQSMGALDHKPGNINDLNDSSGHRTAFGGRLTGVRKSLFFVGVAFFGAFLLREFRTYLSYYRFKV